MKLFALIILLTASTAHALPVGFVTGDSYSNGTRDWPAYVTAVELHSTAIAGQRLEQMAPKFEQELGDHLAEYGDSIAIIQGGTNDLSYRPTDVSDMKGYTTSMTDIAREMGIEFYVMNIPPRNVMIHESTKEQLLEYNQWLADTYGAKVIDIYTVLEDPNKSGFINPIYDYDGLHPNNAGFRLIASAVDLQLTTVPVPAAAWLFGSALIGLAGIGRSRS